MLEARQVAEAYARWIADGEPDFQALMSPDLHDHVSGGTGPQTWDMVWSWIEKSFEERRAELLNLLATLKSEVAELSKTHSDQAQSIAGFTNISAHEATRAEQNPELLNLSLKGLTSSVEGFESSHPQLVRIVNSISQTLSNLGI